MLSGTPKWALGAACVVLLTSGAALAGDKAIVLITIDGVEGARAQQVRANLVGGLIAAGFDVVPADEVERKLQSAPELRDCSTAVCWQGVGRQIGVPYVLAGRVSVFGETYSLELRAIDSVKGDLGVQLKEECIACRTDDANDWLSNNAASLRVALDKVVHPAQKPMEAIAPPPRDMRKTWALRGAGLAAGALGLGALIFGFAEAGLHDEVVCDPRCSRRDTSGGMAFGFVTGGVLLAGAAVLLYYGWRPAADRAPAKVTLLPAAGPRGGGLSLQVRF
jgi:hypothetical protein